MVYVVNGLKTNLLGLPAITALGMVAREDATSTTTPKGNNTPELLVTHLQSLTGYTTSPFLGKGFGLSLAKLGHVGVRSCRESLGFPQDCLVHQLWESLWLTSVPVQHLGVLHLGSLLLFFSTYVF